MKTGVLIHHQMIQMHPVGTVSIVALATLIRGRMEKLPQEIRQIIRKEANVGIFVNHLLLTLSSKVMIGLYLLIMLMN